MPNKPLSLFKITAGDGSGGGLEPPCPRNAAGQRVSEAGAGEGPLHGGPRDADGFLMKAFDDALKIVIYEDMTQGEREFAIAFMEQDTPAPPGTPNACLSKYERAIIATYNDITTAEMNGDTHISELLKREAGKPRPERVPENPLVLPGVKASNSFADKDPKRPTTIVAPPKEMPKSDDLKKAAGATSGGGIGDLEPPEFEGPGIDLKLPVNRDRKFKLDEDGNKVLDDDGKPIQSSPFIPPALIKNLEVRFKTIDEAAIAMLQAASVINQQVEHEVVDEKKQPPRELGGVILSDPSVPQGGKKYFYNSMQIGELSEINIGALSGTVAVVHTHPPDNLSEPMPVDDENKRLSPEDLGLLKEIEAALGVKVPAYLATPFGAIVKFNPGKWNGDGEIIAKENTVKY